ncbi:fasciclin domain-containing protein [Bacteroides sp.]
MKKIQYSISVLILLLFATVFVPSCVDDDVEGDAFYTFTGETVASYCENRTNFSIFSQIIKESETVSLLASYGHFTCFVPVDSAFQKYFDAKGITYNDLTKEDKQKIVYNHVIKSEYTNYETESFTEGSLPEPSMSDRFINISFTGFTEGNQTILVNQEVPILYKDVKVHNGIIHVVGNIIDPSNAYLTGLLQDKEYFSLFSQALEQTGLSDSIMHVYDFNYEKPAADIVDGIFKYPETKKYGYTVFAETNETFEKAGIETLDELVEYAIRYYGNEAPGDYKNRKNALNKFVSYHILERQMSTSDFLYSGGATAADAEKSKFEYYETMLQYRLIEIKSGNKLNTQQDGTCVSINDSQSNLNGLNGYIHALNEILVYDKDVMENDVLNKRIRFDCYAIPPQLTNNNIRWKCEQASYTLTPDYCGDYFTFTNDTKLRLWADENWSNYQADEMVMLGWYDFTLRMHPVPPGTYEIRLGYRAESWRGVAQLFIDNEIVGIPVDLRIEGPDPRVGWVDDGETVDDGVENDKMMRNRGYMKAPTSIYTPQYGGITLRQHKEALRIIIGTFTFQDYAPHYFRAKNVEAENLQFHFDYLEYVPVSYIEREGRD